MCSIPLSETLIAPLKLYHYFAKYNQRFVAARWLLRFFFHCFRGQISFSEPPEPRAP